MENIEIRELVASLGSDDDSLRKMAAFKLQSIISDPSFADMFIAEGGLPNLRLLTLEASGNTLAYGLTSLTRLLDLDQGWEIIRPDLIDRVMNKVCLKRGALRLPSPVIAFSNRCITPFSEHPSRRNGYTGRHRRTPFNKTVR